MDKEIWIASYSNKSECFHLETLTEHTTIGQCAAFRDEEEITDYDMVAAFEDFSEANAFIEHLKDQRNQNLVLPRKKLLRKMPKESDGILGSWVVSCSWSEGFIHMEKYSEYVEYVRQGFILGHPVENYFVIGMFSIEEKAVEFVEKMHQLKQSIHHARRLKKRELQDKEILKLRS